MNPSKNFKVQLYETDCKILIKSVTKFEESEENFNLCLDYTLSNLLYHSYQDVDSHKVNRIVSGLHEKFLIQSDLEKANTFKAVSEKLLKTVDSHYGAQKENGYRILALLLWLAEAKSCPSTEVTTQHSDNVIKEDFDWAEYLKEGEEVYNYFSDSSSEISISDTESEEDVVHDLLPLPPRDDSGLGISPDSCSGSSQQQFNDNHFPVPISQDTQSEDFPVPVYQNSFYPYWIPKYQQTYSVTKYNLKTVNFTKIWEESLLNQFGAIEKKTILHERNVIKEVLWILHGIKNSFLFQWDNSEFKVNSNIHLCNLTSYTLTVLMREFCEYGTKVVFLQKFVENVLVDGSSLSKCLTFQTFAAALQTQLRSISSSLCKIEKSLRKKNETFTILNLKEKLKIILKDIDTLYFMHQEMLAVVSNMVDPVERACSLLQFLWSYLSRQILKEPNSSAVKITLRVFLKTCKPLFTFLEKLIVFDTFEDPCEEFFFIRQDVNVTDETFWEHSLILKKLPTQVEKDFFLKPFLNDFLITGKSVQILNKINFLLKATSPQKNIHGELYLKFIRIIQKLVCKKGVEEAAPNIQEEESRIEDPLLKQKIFALEGSRRNFFCPDTNPMYLPAAKRKPVELFSKNQIETLGIIENLEPNVPRILKRNILKSIEICMNYACFPICGRLMNLLKEKYHIMTHILNMRKYFLMESGDLMFSFYSTVFEKIFYNESWQDISFLYSALQNAISESKECCENLGIYLDSQNSEVKIKKPLSFLNSLQLFYEVEWPISIILGTQVQTQYSEIFSFLLQIKCAKYLLDKLYSIRLDASGTAVNEIVKAISRHEYPKQQKTHGMYIMRMRLLFFVNGLHNYIMSRIHNSFDVEFSKELQNSRTIDDVIVVHNAYLKSLHEKCLLDKRLLRLKEQICDVLNLCYTFQQLWLKGIDRVCLEDLQNIEEKFSKYCNFLFCVFNTSLRRGVYSHLENLVNLMLSETHTLRVFDNEKGLPEYTEFRKLLNT
ncbi:gamma-tubulin complex component 5-like [Uloborus diversus]|uniref:gamma-tubulin complex component 5-like n=1 Tax=Uloborus diversus TaxID=327109 RepID=UPI002409F1CE|nr:gamma-tubulin complex component 5-like [Uloborus diversus]